MFATFATTMSDSFNPLWLDIRLVDESGDADTPDVAAMDLTGDTDPVTDEEDTEESDEEDSDSAEV